MIRVLPILLAILYALAMYRFPAGAPRGNWMRDQRGWPTRP
jgi:hypothetical protein